MRTTRLITFQNATDPFRARTTCRILLENHTVRHVVDSLFASCGVVFLFPNSLTKVMEKRKTWPDGHKDVTTSSKMSFHTKDTCHGTISALWDTREIAKQTWLNCESEMKEFSGNLSSFKCGFLFRYKEVLRIVEKSWSELDASDRETKSVVDCTHADQLNAEQSEWQQQKPQKFFKAVNRREERNKKQPLSSRTKWLYWVNGR